MISRIIDLAVRNKLLVIVLTIAASIAGYWSLRKIAVDALPDSGDTQVIVYSRWDRSPDLIEAQVTYPIVSAMLGAPRVKSVRGFSDFGYSFVYVIFDEGTETYWARSRALEYLTAVLPHLPEGARAELGADATGVGWVFQYALIDDSGKHSLADLRSFQDWYLRYYLKSVPGVAEVAAVGGFDKQYQVNLDPLRLQAYGISIDKVVEAVRGGNSEVGGRLIEFGRTEYMVRGRGYARSLQDFENIALQTREDGTMVRIKDLGRVDMGPDLRRGVSDLDGEGEVVSGTIIMRQGENALKVIERVKAKLKQVAAGLPAGVRVVPIYDRSDLIRRSMDTLKTTLTEVIATVVLVILVFLWHPASAAIPSITIPVAILIACIPLRLLGVSANIMSLSGIAIAVGALVDAAIVVVEQTHKKLELWHKGGCREDHHGVVIQAIKEVAGPSFFALLVIGIAFLPVLTLKGQEGRLFRPLAYAKTIVMVMAAILAITLDPALRVLLTRVRNFDFRPRWLCQAVNRVAGGQIHYEEKNVLNRVLNRLYEPVLLWALRSKWLVIPLACAAVFFTIPAFRGLGSEFMPELKEGALLYMPSTEPGISIGEAQRLLQTADRVIRQFPEVEHVLGKAGRAETSTDPAPLSMFETVITLKPNSEWRRVVTWYSSWPEWIKPALRHITPDHLTEEELVSQLNRALTIPGLSNSWTMPVKGRIDMQTTGMRSQLGLKVSGSDAKGIEATAVRIEAVLPTVRGTRAVFAERTNGGSFLDVEWDREQLARHGVTLADAQTGVQSAIGGENVTFTVEGPERHPVNVRYMRDFRSDPDSLGSVLVSAEGGRRQVALGALASIRTVNGPAMLRNEDGLLTGYVYVDLAGRDPASYIADAAGVIRDKVALPPGYVVSWSGQYEGMERVKAHLQVIVPVTVFLICLLLYLNTRSVGKTLIVLLAVPFSAVGAIWFVYFLGYNMSVAVWVGLVALMGVDAETGVFMLLYLDLAYQRAKEESSSRTASALRRAVVEGAAKRLRPKFMTVATMAAGLVPVMWATGTGSEMMKHIAAPMIGGIFTSFVLELLIYPAVYELWKSRLGRRWNAREEEVHESFCPEGLGAQTRAEQFA